MSADTAMQTRTESRPQETTVDRVRQGPQFVPAVDIVETPDELTLIADVPGARPEDIDIQYEHGLLTIEARVARRNDPAKTNYLLQEYEVGDFLRSFRIGEGIDGPRIHAETKDGVLTLHLPKVEAHRRRKIEVKSA